MIKFLCRFSKNAQKNTVTKTHIGHKMNTHIYIKTITVCKVSTRYSVIIPKHRRDLVKENRVRTLRLSNKINEAVQPEQWQ